MAHLQTPTVNQLIRGKLDYHNSLCIWLIVNHRKYHVKAGESFLTRPYTLIEYYPEEENPWEYMWVDFLGNQVENWVEHTQFEEKNRCEWFLFLIID